MTIDEQIDRIKQAMPETYKAIQAKAATVGNNAYRWVRKGLSGEPNFFWAMECGHVMGTPFTVAGIQNDVAATMVEFGVGFVVMFRLEVDHAPA
jgi:hypothetical protein